VYSWCIVAHRCRADLTPIIIGYFRVVLIGYEEKMTLTQGVSVFLLGDLN
jgi:hypothetical protein